MGFVLALKDWRGLQKLRWGWERRGVVSGTIQGRGHGSAKGMEWCTSQRPYSSGCFLSCPYIVSIDPMKAVVTPFHR